MKRRGAHCEDSSNIYVVNNTVEEEEEVKHLYFVMSVGQEVKKNRKLNRKES